MLNSWKEAAAAKLKEAKEAIDATNAAALQDRSTTNDNAEVEYLRVENEALKARIRDSESASAVAKLEEQLAAKTADHEKLLEKSKELMRRYKELRSNAAAPPSPAPATSDAGVPREAQQELAKLNAAVNSVENDEASKQRQQALQAELDAARAAATEMENELARLKLGESESTKALQALSLDFQAKLAEKQAEIEELKSNTESVRAENSVVLQTLFSKQAEVDSALEAAKQSEAKANAAQQRIAELEQDQTNNEELATLKQQLEDELSACRKRIVELESTPLQDSNNGQVVALKHELEQVTNELQAKTVEFEAKLQADADQLAAAQQKIQELEKQSNDEELAALKQELEHTQVLVAERTKELEQGEAKALELETKLIATQQRIGELERAQDNSEELAALKQELEHVQLLLTERTSELEQAKQGEAKHLELEAKLGATQQRIAELEQAQGSNEAIDVLKQQMEHAQALVNESANEVQAKTRELEQCEAKLNAEAELLVAAKHKIVELEQQQGSSEELEVLRQQLEQLHGKELAALKEQTQVLTDELQVKSLALEQNQAKLEADAELLATAKHRITELEQAQDNGEELAALKQQLEHAQVLVNESASDLQAKTLELEQNTAKAVELEAKLQADAELFATAKQRVAELEQRHGEELTTLKQQFEQLQSKAEDSTNELQNKTLALEQSEAKLNAETELLTAAKQRVVELEQQQQSSSAELATLKERIQILTNDVEQSNDLAQVEAMQSLLNNQTTQWEMTQSELTASIERCTALESQLVVHEECKSNLTAAVEQAELLTAKLATAEQEASEMETALQQTRQELANVNSSATQQDVIVALQLEINLQALNYAGLVQNEANSQQLRVEIDRLERELKESSHNEVDLRVVLDRLERQLAKTTQSTEIDRLQHQFNAALLDIEMFYHEQQATHVPNNGGGEEEIAMLQDKLNTAEVNLRVELDQAERRYSKLVQRTTQLEQEQLAVIAKRNEYYEQLCLAQETVALLGDKFNAKEEQAERLTVELQEERLRVEETELAMRTDFERGKFELQRRFEEKQQAQQEELALAREQAEASSVACLGMQNQLRQAQADFAKQQREFESLKERTRVALVREHEEKKELQEALKQAKLALTQAKQVPSVDTEALQAKIQSLEQDLLASAETHEQAMQVRVKQAEEESVKLLHNAQAVHRDEIALLRKEIDKHKHELQACLKESKIRKDRAEKLLAEHEAQIEKLTLQLRHDPSQALQDDLRAENESYRTLLHEKEQDILRLEADVSFQRHKLSECNAALQANTLAARQDPSSVYLKNVLVSYMCSTNTAEQLGMVKAISQLAGFSSEEHSKIRTVLEAQNQGVFGKVAGLWGSVATATDSAASPPTIAAPAGAAPRVMKRLSS